MRRATQIPPRQILTILHDVFMTAVAIITAFLLRFEADGLF